MYCSQCGKELLEDSLFCMKCGNEVGVPLSKKNNKKNIIKSKIEIISKNQKLNIICVIIFIIIACLGYSQVKQNIPKVSVKKDLVEITQEIIDLQEEHPFLGSNVIEKRELKEYKKDLYKFYTFTALGVIMIAVSILIIYYMLYELFKSVNQNRNEV